MNSLVVAPQWLGDAVMTEPLLRRLAARGERITVAALPAIAPLYRAMPQVAQVLEIIFARGQLQWAARRALAQTWRGQFDAAYVLPNSWKSALLPWLAGIPRRVGYQGEARFLLLNKRQPNPKSAQRPPMVAFYSALADEPHYAADRPQLQLEPALADATIAKHGQQRRNYLVFAPGSEYGPAKRWPATHYAELAQSLALPVVLLGSSKEAGLCAEIAALAPGRCTNLAGQTSISEALQWISAAAQVVSNDSGLMHVAAAFGVPQVAVFGSSDPRHTPPLSDVAQVVWLKTDATYQPPLDCAPCFQRACPLGHTRCLQDISPQRVQQLLAP